MQNNLDKLKNYYNKFLFEKEKIIMFFFFTKIIKKKK